ncbi:hypothetical protein [Streptomyces griseomycini]|uniref:Uncharacterized protein n=1 Tax=Streptomyces griseomycini TaxID=66895 RepID=A0A7W7PUW3_9ACTN|nr:hypothetical protein [Streptomyces griseomycini]MBB4901735.1 hypothetical protein [Streptomyces griseomycini]GGQ30657.1 hypothetical protein GCM10010266_62360 [Streptomyces griseomycini]GGR50266.1 hypothetical protein GCM10015536_64860 [Streptomyces griseomycini]
MPAGTAASPPQVPPVAEPSAAAVAPPVRDVAWDRITEYLDPDGPDLLALAGTLAARGVPAAVYCLRRDRAVRGASRC